MRLDKTVDPFYNLISLRSKIKFGKVIFCIKIFMLYIYKSNIYMNLNL